MFNFKPKKKQLAEDGRIASERLFEPDMHGRYDGGGALRAQSLIIAPYCKSKPAPVTTYNTLFIFTTEANTFIGLDNTSDFKIQFSYDGKVWQDMPITGLAVENKETYVYLRREVTADCTADKYDKFKIDKAVCLGGDMRSMIKPEKFDEDFDMPYEYAYYKMFEGCPVSLDTQDEKAYFQLGYETLKAHCYEDMFSGCGLSGMMDDMLAAQTMAPYCYAGMFRDGTMYKLPLLPHNTLEEGCFKEMFQNCVFLTEAWTGCPDPKEHPTHPELKAHCYEGMFDGCTNIDSATCCYLFPTITDDIPEDAFLNWLRGVKAEGTFDGIEDADWVIGGSGNPWRVEPFYVYSESGDPDVRFNNEGNPQYSDLIFEYDGKRYTEEEWYSDETRPVVEANKKVYIRRTYGEFTAYDYQTIEVSGADCHFGGDIDSLVYGGEYETQGGVLPYCYAHLFEGCNAHFEDLELGEPELYAEGCYDHMFAGSYIKEAKELNGAAELEPFCFRSMYEGCPELDTLNPSMLPFWTLAESCYEAMFKDCEKIATILNLHASDLAKNCYKSMFEGCVMLGTAMPLPSERLAEGCYQNMFKGCTELELNDSYNLPAEEVPDHAYQCMFMGCTKLTHTPFIAAEAVGKGAMTQMFFNCNRLALVTIPNFKYANIGYDNENYAFLSWMHGVADKGVFNEHGDYNLPFIPGEHGNPWYENANNAATPEGQPEGTIPAEGGRFGFYFVGDADWTLHAAENLRYFVEGESKKWEYVNTSDIEVPAGKRIYLIGKDVTLGSFEMTSAEDVHVKAVGDIRYLTQGAKYTDWTTEAADVQYDYLFEDCAVLTDIDNLRMPFTKVGLDAMEDMFAYCTGLTTILPYALNCMLPALTLGEGCYMYMFLGCTNLTDAPKLPSGVYPNLLADYCYTGMFEGCSALTDIPQLNATKIPDHAYERMFRGCTSIESATGMAYTNQVGVSGMESMFEGSGLKTSPALPSKDLGDRAYAKMFYGCASLETATDLFKDGAVTAMGKEVFEDMFAYCVNLTTAPFAYYLGTTEGLYRRMFLGCEKLVAAEPIKLESPEVAKSAYEQMFKDCAELTGERIPLLDKVTTVGEDAMKEMFKGCTKVDKIVIDGFEYPNEGYTNADVNSPFTDWLNGTAATGTFVSKAKSLWPINVHGNPWGTSLYVVTDAASAPDDNPDDTMSVHVRSLSTPPAPTPWADADMYYFREGDNDSKHWHKIISSTQIDGVKYGEKVFFSAANVGVGDDQKMRININADREYRIGGNILNLVEHGAPTDTTTAPAYGFWGLFSELDNRLPEGMWWHTLKGFKSDFALPFTKLSTESYREMFFHCTELEETPELKATEMKDRCYYGMFEGCTSLHDEATMPHPTELAVGCFERMYCDCSGIKKDIVIHNESLTSNVLPADCYMAMFRESGITGVEFMGDTIAASGQACLAWMFYNCPNLTRCVNLKIAATGIDCCDAMFKSCHSLLSAGLTVTAETLQQNAFRNMYQDCDALTSNINLQSVKTIDKNCCDSMMMGCEAITSFTLPKSTNVAEACYVNMFAGCKSLANVTWVPTNTTAIRCYENMFGCNYLKEGGQYNWTGCEALVSAPFELMATELSEGCYCKMFWKAKSLKTGPNYSAANRVMALPATKLNIECYKQMFSGCTMLNTYNYGTETPIDIQIGDMTKQTPLELALGCFFNTFDGCSKVDKVSPYYIWQDDEAPAERYFQDWLRGVAGIGSFWDEVEPYVDPTGKLIYWDAGASGNPWKPELYFEALEPNSQVEFAMDATGCVQRSMIQYGLTQDDGTINWIDYAGAVTLEHVGDRVYFRRQFDGTRTELATGTGYDHFVTLQGSFNLGGNMLSMANGVKWNVPVEGGGILTHEYTFLKMFENCTGIKDISELNMGAMKLKGHDYEALFLGCWATDPVLVPPMEIDLEKFNLPNAIAAPYSYKDMFTASNIKFVNNGTDTGARLNLPTNMAEGTCENTFRDSRLGDASLIDIDPIAVADSCYKGMFFGCSNMKQTPHMNFVVGGASISAKSFCENMYGDCTKLEEVWIDKFDLDEATIAADAFKDWLHHVATYGIFHEKEKYMWETNNDSRNPWDNPFYTEALVDGTQIGLNSVGAPSVNKIEYNLDDGQGWHNYAITNGAGEKFILNKGERVYWRRYLSGDLVMNTNASLGDYHIFQTGTTSSDSIAVGGNIASMVWEHWSANDPDYATRTDYNYCLGRLLSCGYIRDVDKLHLLDRLTEGCYYSLLWGSGVNHLPNNFLADVDLAKGCYYSMFAKCSGLTRVPDDLLSNKRVMAPFCYWGMFSNCTSLVELPKLPNQDPYNKTVTLADGCWKSMFQNCTSITTIPKHYLNVNLSNPPALPDGSIGGSTVQPWGTYSGVFCDMFLGCTSLTTITPCSSSGHEVLPYTTLAFWCYGEMFSGCKSLDNLPSKFFPTTILSMGDTSTGVKGTSAFANMFRNCTSMKSIPNEWRLDFKMGAGSEGSNTSWCSSMFYGCTSLQSVPENLLVNKVCTNNIYTSMFDGCASLTNAPYINLTSQGSASCKWMFKNCTSLIGGPKATKSTETTEGVPDPDWVLHGFNGTNGSGAFQEMFYGCTSLEASPIMDTDLSGFNWSTSSWDHCKNMFSGCSTIKRIDIPNLPYDDTLIPTSTTKTKKQYFVEQRSFDGWTAPIFNADGTIKTPFNDFGVEGAHPFNCLAGSQWPAGGSGNPWMGPLYTKNLGAAPCTFSMYPKSASTASPGDSYKYSLDNINWNEYTPGTDITCPSGKCVYWERTLSTPATETNCDRIHTTATSYEAGGNVMSLIEGGNFGGAESTKYAWALGHLFDSTNLTNIDNLKLPATQLSNYCYAAMFNGCSKLASIPYSDDNPFIKATSTSGVTGAFYIMFGNTASLTAIPKGVIEVIETAGPDTFDAMFKSSGVESIDPSVSINVLDAPKTCCQYMFQSSKIKSLPSDFIKTESISGDSAFFQMFEDCKSLTSISNLILRPTSITYQSYKQMFEGCISLTEIFDHLYATQLRDSACAAMFKGCTSLMAIPTNFFEDNISLVGSSGSHMSEMFKDCNNESLIVLPNMEFLSQITGASQAFGSMFQGCTHIADASHIEIGNGTLLVKDGANRGTYESMFEGCTSLQKSPKIMYKGCDTIGATATRNAFTRMFYGCTSLEKIEIPNFEYTTSLTEQGDPFKNWVGDSNDPTTCVKDFGVINGGTFVGKGDWPCPADNGNPWPVGFYIANADGNNGAINVTLNMTGSVPYNELKYQIQHADGSKGAPTDYSGQEGTPITLQSGERVYWLRNLTNGCSNKDYHQFAIDGDFLIGGDLSTFARANGTSTTKRTYAFYSLFKDCTTLTGGIPMNFIPTWVLSNYTCWAMFANSGIETISYAITSEDKETLGGKGIFYGMFQDCKKLISIRGFHFPLSHPGAGEAYAYADQFARMFMGCTSLTDIGDKTLFLPNSISGLGGYSETFKDCASLTTLDKHLLDNFEGSTLTSSSFSKMFYNCSSLTTIPDIPDMTAETGAFQNMYGSCDGLVDLGDVEFNIKNLTANVYYNMFHGNGTDGAKNLEVSPKFNFESAVEGSFSAIGVADSNGPIRPLRIMQIPKWERPSEEFHLGIWNASKTPNRFIGWHERVAEGGILISPSTNWPMDTVDTDGCPTGWTLQTP